MTDKKLAVVLLNLGGPLKKEDIEPFLFNFFMDKNIISAPNPIRYFLAKYISKKRSKGAANLAYRELGYKSPLLENTKKQARKLEKFLKSDIPIGFSSARVFVSMRYWQPLAKDVVTQVKEYSPTKIILLPLYPQYSTATSKSSIENWLQEAKKAGLNTDTTFICCYPEEQSFIKASAKNIEISYRDAIAKNPDISYRILFSAHGLPQKTIDAGDPYQEQLEKTANSIVNILSEKIKNLDWQLCYQSRLGPLKWIEPYTENAIKKAVKDKKGIIIYPLAFVSEHVETLVEIELEYRKFAKNLKVLDFVRVPCLGDSDIFIKSLLNIVKFSLHSGMKTAICCGHSKKNICSNRAKKCPCLNCKE